MVLGKNIAHDMKSGAEGAHFFGALLLTFSFDKHRTVAFQVPEELFEQFKEYLKQHNMKQNAFFLDCIRQALEHEQES